MEPRPLRRVRVLALAAVIASPACRSGADSALTVDEGVRGGDAAAPAAAVDPPAMAAPAEAGGGAGSPPANPAADPAPAAPPAPAISSEGDGKMTIGPDYSQAPAMKRNPSVPRGQEISFEMKSSDSKIYPGLNGDYTRNVRLYKPAGYVDDQEAPFMVVQDGGGYESLLTALDNLIAAKKLPPMLALLIDSGGGDGRGSERGLEYDTVSDAYHNFIETEVLPKVAKEQRVRFTANPEGRATMGGSSGGACAFTMAWFHPESYRRVLTYSGTYVNQAPDTTYPHSAWSYHEFLIAQAPMKPLRVYLEVGEHDNNSDGSSHDGMHNWIVANDRMAAALAAKGYHVRFQYALGAGHVDGNVIGQTLPDALLWLWRGYTGP